MKKKGIAKFVNYPKLKISPSKTDQDLFNEFKENLITELKLVYKRVRKNQLESIIDKIVSGKRKRGDQRTKEDIFEEELNRSCTINDDNVLWPIFCAHSQPMEGSEVSEDVVLAKTTPTKLAIFIDLWEKGYYITPGNKFGGDFLLYLGGLFNYEFNYENINFFFLGDPIVHHAVNIVRCILVTDKFHSTELIAFSRLGTSVKKRTIFAALKENGNISYITLNWLDT